MTLNEYLAEQGLNAEEIAAIVGNEKQSKAMTAALSRYEEGQRALATANAEKADTEKYWTEKTQQLEGFVTAKTAADKRIAVESGERARLAAYLKSLADQGYDVPKDMYEGAPPVKAADGTDHSNFVTREDFSKGLRGTAPDLVSLTALSNEYRSLFGEDYTAIEDDFRAAQQAGKPLREFARSKYNFDAKRTEKQQAAEKVRIDGLVAEQLKTKEAELAAKYGSNPNLAVPMPSKFDKLQKQEGFKSDSWKSEEGRRANREARLKKFENVSLQ